MSKEENEMKLNPDLALTVLTGKEAIPISYISKELKEEGFFLTTESAKKALQRKTKLNLTLKQCRGILSVASENYIKDIKYKPTPARISVSLTSTEKYKDKQKKEAENIKSNLKKDEIANKKFLDSVYSLAEQPLINNNDFPAEETEKSNDFGKALFVDFLSPQAAYILMQNTDAFKRIVQEPEMFRFCGFVMELDKESKKELREMGITLSGTLSAIVESLNDELFRDWLKIRNGHYKKMVDLKLTEKRSKISEKELDISIFSEDEKKDLDYMAEQFFVEECWKHFQEQMEVDFSKDSTGPLAMICLTDILEDVDLLIGFLCCDSTSRELLLSKAQELVEQKNSAAQQATK